MAACLLVAALTAGCVQAEAACPEASPVMISEAINFFDDETQPFQFPLDNPAIFVSHRPFMTLFATAGTTHRGPEYHAAEDIVQPPGTPVYAIADGEVSFSGPMGGYGWLVIVDHPQANLYSLYGHLSPSRWQIETGPVQKGDLLGYLGDPDENGGTPENPLIPHLHFGIRAGQRIGYSGQGQWRWMAGWIKLCPQDLGWLQPSVVIMGQDRRAGQDYEPPLGFAQRWTFELVFSGVYGMGALGSVIYAIRKDDYSKLVFIFAILLIAGFMLSPKSIVLTYALCAMAALLLVVGVYRRVRHSA